MPTCDCDGDVRYYISSFASDAKRFADAVRVHWEIENSLHWVMDVTFREDDARIHKHYGGENVSRLRRLAISLNKRDTTIKDSIRSKRIRAGYDVEFLKQMLACLSGEIQVRSPWQTRGPFRALVKSAGVAAEGGRLTIEMRPAAETGHQPVVGGFELLSESLDQMARTP